MSWRPAHSLNVLRAQVDAAYPDRPEGADGMIGDARHQAEKSDHNPNSRGVVCAWDITTDDRFTDRLAEDLRVLGKHGDGRVKYVIFKGRIAGPAAKGWEWRPYSGFSKHFDHIHLSVVGTAAQYDRKDPWPVALKTKPAPKPIPKEPDVTPEQIEQTAQRAAALVREDIKVLLYGTKDGSHWFNLKAIAEKLGLGK